MTYWERRRKEEEAEQEAKRMEGTVEVCPACHHLTLTKVTVIVANDIWACSHCPWSGKRPKLGWP
jgi:ribosomal protein L37AE/L43A